MWKLKLISIQAFCLQFWPKPQWTLAGLWVPPKKVLSVLSCQTFTEGLTNKLIGCFVGSLQENGCVLVRLYGRMTELYVNREREVQMFQVLHSYRCGPQIYCTFQNGICYEFVPGTVLDDTLVRQPPIYRLVYVCLLCHWWNLVWYTNNM